MKLLINNDFEHSFKLDYPEHFDDLTVVVQQRLRNEFCVFCALNKISETEATFKLLAQKITLDSTDMNTVLYLLGYSGIEFKLRYAALGGEGCDLTLEMIPCQA